MRRPARAPETSCTVSRRSTAEAGAKLLIQAAHVLREIIAARAAIRSPLLTFARLPQSPPWLAPCSRALAMDHSDFAPVRSVGARALTSFILVVVLSARASAQAPVPPPQPTPLAEPTTPAEPIAPREPLTQPAVVDAPPAPRPAAQPPCAPCRREHKGVEGAGGFMIGIVWIDLSELNDALKAAGYEELDTAMTLLGGQALAVFPSGFVVGGHGAAILAPSADGPDSFRASFSGGYGMADLGFAFLHTRALLLTLTGGIGGYGMGLHISERRAFAFDDVLENPRRSTSLNVGGLLVGLTLGFDGRVPIGDVDEKGMRPFFSLGVRAGGMYGPPMSEWSLDDRSESPGGPNTTLSAAYVALVLSFGGAPAETAATSVVVN
jgi:hypothetical protein